MNLDLFDTPHNKEKSEIETYVDDVFSKHEDDTLKDIIKEVEDYSKNFNKIKDNIESQEEQNKKKIEYSVYFLSKVDTAIAYLINDDEEKNSQDIIKLKKVSEKLNKEVLGHYALTMNAYFDSGPAVEKSMYSEDEWDNTMHNHDEFIRDFDGKYRGVKKL